MIWEQKSKAILMLNNLVERGQVKCYKYWPDGEANGDENELIFEDVNIKVELSSTHKFDYYMLRKFKLTDILVRAWDGYLFLNNNLCFYLSFSLKPQERYCTFILKIGLIMTYLRALTPFLSSSTPSASRVASIAKSTVPLSFTAAPELVVLELLFS